MSSIPAADAQNIGMTFFEAARKFYENPKNLKAFEDWDARQNKNRDYKEV